MVLFLVSDFQFPYLASVVADKRGGRGCVPKGEVQGRRVGGTAT